MALVALIAGCATARMPDATVTTAAVTPGSQGALVSASAPSHGRDYRIGPADILDVSVFQVPDLGNTVQVSGNGQIVLPLIGAVHAAGRTVEELQAEISARLGAKYLQSPQVTVLVKEALSQRITVEGAVNKPGIYATSGEATLLQAVALAGGLDRVADERGVIVFREIGGKRTAAVFDVAAIRAGRQDDPVVQGGDLIVVDQSGVKAAMRGIRESVGVIGLFTPLL